MEGLVKRKSLSIRRDNAAKDLYPETNFYKKFANGLKRGLKDNHETAEWKLNEKMRYLDDPNEETWEIARLNGKEYLVFLFSMFHIAYPNDEAQFFALQRVQIDVNLQSHSSHSKFHSLWTSIALAVVMVLVFLAIMYALFPQLRGSAFLLINKKLWYQQISTSED